MNIYIVRHGKTEYNRDSKMQGWADSPLLPESLEQANDLGKALLKEELKFDKVYTSDLFRTVDTAANILKGLEVEHDIIQKEALREMYFGKAEALEFTAVWPKVAKELGYKNEEEIFDTYSAADRCNLIHKVEDYNEAETKDQFYARVLGGLHEVVEENKDNEDYNILIVAHGLTILGILEQLGYHADTAKSFDNLSVSHIKYDGEYSLGEINKSYI